MSAGPQHDERLTRLEEAAAFADRTSAEEVATLGRKVLALERRLAMLEGRVEKIGEQDPEGAP